MFQAFVISTMQRLFRAWKARLSRLYSKYNTNEERLSHRPEDVELEDWKYLIQYFGSQDFKRNPITGEIDTADKVWEIQHTRKDDRGELGQLQEVVAQQQSEEIEHPMTRDEILSTVLGERT
ncbi:uncharacterized protein [Nicotiana tomentosiformis]|uniref:uncharacterized protein isoform X3 n=1 Tax=Nicotiana tomentosiformis TaxID=4098 RepID=UPI00388CAEB0